MAAGVQCDTCRRFAPRPDGRWLYVVRQPSEPSFLASIAGPAREDPDTFCSMGCLAEWAYVQAIAIEPAAGTET